MVTPRVVKVETTPLSAGKIRDFIQPLGGRRGVVMLLHGST
jgi:hypothetical protein